jgi:uncharacterized protein (DUF1697 family)
VPGKQHGWVALLRAINVGGRNAVPMARLRPLFEENGCRDVRTYIQSGNVVFTSSLSKRATLGERLEQAVETTFGVAAAVVLRTFDEIGAVVRSHPFGPDTSNTFVCFLTAAPGAAEVRKLAALDFGDDRFEVFGSDVYLQYPNGVRGGRLTGSRLERQLGVPGTARNWRTVARLAEMVKPGL